MVPGPHPSFQGLVVEVSYVRLGPHRASRRQAQSICPHPCQTCGRPNCCRCCWGSRDETRGLDALLHPRRPSLKAPHPLELADQGSAVGVDRLDQAYLRLGSYRPSPRRSVTQGHLDCSIKIHHLTSRGAQVPVIWTLGGPPTCLRCSMTMFLTRSRYAGLFRSSEFE